MHSLGGTASLHLPSFIARICLADALTLPTELAVKFKNPTRSVGLVMHVKVTRRFQVTIPREVRERAGIAVGDVVDVRYEDGRVVVEKVSGRWEEVMDETAGAWAKHPIFGKMRDAVEIVKWLRGEA